MATSDAVLSVVDATESWHQEIADLQRRAEAAGTGLVASLRLTVHFVGPNVYPGAKVIRADDWSLCVEVSLPAGIVRERRQMVLLQLQEALDAAEDYVLERGRPDDLWAVERVMVRLTSGGTPFERWMDSYALAHHQPDSLPTLACPSCGTHALRLEFEVKDPCAAYGTAYFWCDNCLTGPMPAPAPIPPGTKTTPWGSLNPPNYSIIPES
jgi:hypothetical protein